MRELGGIKEAELPCRATCKDKRRVYRYVYESGLSGVEEPFTTISKLLLDKFLGEAQRTITGPA